MNEWMSERHECFLNWMWTLMSVIIVESAKLFCLYIVILHFLFNLFSNFMAVFIQTCGYRLHLCTFHYRKKYYYFVINWIFWHPIENRRVCGTVAPLSKKLNSLPPARHFRNCYVYFRAKIEQGKHIKFKSIITFVYANQTQTHRYHMFH